MRRLERYKYCGFSGPMSGWRHGLIYSW